ncbi:MAG: hypothetical protein KAR06_05720 [Deltaproteobacteria bacterium]|nr:hypothetical protein [Deltaproteobacteria bacterium]
MQPEVMSQDIDPYYILMAGVALFYFVSLLISYRLSENIFNVMMGSWMLFLVVLGGIMPLMFLSNDSGGAFGIAADIFIYVLIMALFLMFLMLPVYYTWSFMKKYKKDGLWIYKHEYVVMLLYLSVIVVGYFNVTVGAVMLLVAFILSFFIYRCFKKGSMVINEE